MQWETLSGFEAQSSKVWLVRIGYPGNEETSHNQAGESVFLFFFFSEIYWAVFIAAECGCVGEGSQR